VVSSVHKLSAAGVGGDHLSDNRLLVGAITYIWMGGQQLVEAGSRQREECVMKVHRRRRGRRRRGGGGQANIDSTGLYPGFHLGNRAHPTVRVTFDQLVERNVLPVKHCICSIAQPSSSCSIREGGLSSWFVPESVVGEG
jgi:hypothetical protein